MGLLHVFACFVYHIRPFPGGRRQLVENNGSDKAEAGLAQNVGAQVVGQHFRRPFLLQENTVYLQEFQSNEG